MGMPIEDSAREVVVNDSSLNIEKGRIAAFKALMLYMKEGVPGTDGMYIPELPADDDRFKDVTLTSYNSIRNAWIAMYEHWKYPDIFVSVQGVNGSIYTQVSKHVLRDSDHSQASLW